MYPASGRPCNVEDMVFVVEDLEAHMRLGEKALDLAVIELAVEIGHQRPGRDRAERVLRSSSMSERHCE